MTWSHTADTNHDRLAVQSERELLSSQDPSVLLFSSVTPPANAICLFLKSELQDVLPARVLFLGGLHNQGPASRSLLLLADCCLQPNPTAWRNVKYSLLNCGAGVGLEPYQALTAEEYYTPDFKHGQTKSTSRSGIRRAFCHLAATHSSRNSCTPQSCLINPPRLRSLSLRGKTFTGALFASIGMRKASLPPPACLQTSAKYAFFHSLPRSCTGKGLSFLAWQDF